MGMLDGRLPSSPGLVRGSGAVLPWPLPPKGLLWRQSAGHRKSASAPRPRLPSAGARRWRWPATSGAAKEAIRAISRTAAREWGRHGITVNVICPFSESPGIDYMIEHVPGFIDELTAGTVLKRLGSSEQDVGRTVAFLASEGGGYISGQTINIDGGMVIGP